MLQVSNFYKKILINVVSNHYSFTKLVNIFEIQNKNNSLRNEDNCNRSTSKHLSYWFRFRDCIALNWSIFIKESLNSFVLKDQSFILFIWKQIIPLFLVLFVQFKMSKVLIEMKFQYQTIFCNCDKFRDVVNGERHISLFDKAIFVWKNVDFAKNIWNCAHSNRTK